ncbi:DUF3221 domain-containing protein [Pontibacter harenae]|uniref:DUF3221 domain-containing protein n=1 Tax=Pontibacter harenae TaxID=2894083 RepID=UPI001E54506B|nr:DUF3221 domain-containing protein [Pontibacter harenae]MCC9167647.1 YobA family protein [Pontibacter harenae]
MKIQAFLVMLLTVLLINCRGEEPKRMPDTLSNIQGRITSMQSAEADDNKVMTTISVEAVEGIASDYPKANIKAGENTLIETDDGQELKVKDLKEGQLVQVWIDGEVMDASTIQAKAIAIKITSE